MQLKGKTILITGGASGIALESIGHFLSEGMKVIICGRDGSKLQGAKSKFPSVATISCDITSEEDVNVLHQLIIGRGGIDILYHNAGVFNVHPLSSREPVLMAANEMNVNYLAAIRLTSMFIPELTTRSESAIIFTTSAVAYQPAAFIATYSASKAALHSYVKSLRHQLKKLHHNITVVELIPPAVDTNATKSFRGNKVSAQQVVKDLIKGLKNNRPTIRVSIARSFYYLQRLSPSMAFNLINPKNPLT